MRKKCLSGFTLIEALMAVSILGFAALGITAALTAGITQNELSGRYTVAANLAQGLLDEILTRTVDDAGTFPAGPGGGETRAVFNNIADYNGLSEPEGGLKDTQGNLLNDPSLAGYSRTAATEYVFLPGQNPAGDPTFISVTVEVKYKGASMVKLKRMISSTERPEF
jgi:type II secretory pathway pseudopilin PulG